MAAASVAGRAELLERHGRAYGERHLAIALTRSLRVENDDFKTVYNWKQTKPLPDGDFGAAWLKGRGERRNPAVCLRRSGLLGIDVDGEEGLRLVREFVPAGLPITVAVRSGRPDGGLHLWYRAPDGAAKVKVQFAATLTLSGDGYLICPPAWHAASETVYRFLDGQAPWETEIATFPQRLLDSLGARAHQDDAAARADDSSPIEEPGRHAHLLRLAGAMRRVGAGEPTITAALLVENDRRCRPPKDEALVLALAKDIVKRYPPGGPDGR